MTPPPDLIGEKWFDDASNKILKAPSIAVAVTLAASYLTELMDAQASHRGEKQLIGDYQRLIDRELLLIDSTLGCNENGEGALWEVAREILRLYDFSRVCTENELTLEAKFTLCQFFPPDKPLNEAIKSVLISVLAYHLGGLEGLPRVEWS